MSDPYKYFTARSSELVPKHQVMLQTPLQFLLHGGYSSTSPSSSSSIIQHYTSDHLKEVSETDCEDVERNSWRNDDSSGSAGASPSCVWAGPTIWPRSLCHGQGPLSYVLCMTLHYRPTCQHWGGGIKKKWLHWNLEKWRVTHGPAKVIDKRNKS